MGLPPIKPGLKKAIKANDLVVFAGAGISRQLGLPSWNSLVIDFIDSIGEEELIPFKSLLKTNTLKALDVLDFIQKEHRREINNFIKKRLAISENPNLIIHSKIISLSTKIITTNYDRGFEAAWAREHNKEANVIWSNNEPDLADLINYENFIFKIHGSINMSQDCILYTSQYKDLYNTDSAFLMELKYLFKNKTLLFIGFSMEDPYVNEVIKTIVNLYKGYSKKHFFITANENTLPLEFKNIIETIKLGTYEDMPLFLDQLILLKPQKTNIPARPYNNFFPRNKSLKSIMNFLNGNISLIIVEGSPGVGKTGLIFETAYICLQKQKVEDSFNPVLFEFVIWLNGEEKIYDELIQIYDTIGSVTNCDWITKSCNDSIDAKTRKVQELLQSHKVLIIVDNFEAIQSKSVKHWIKNIPEPSKVVISTIKNEFLGFPKLLVNGLDLVESYQFIELLLDNDKNLLHAIPMASLDSIIENSAGNLRDLELIAGQIREGNISSINSGANYDVEKNYHELLWNNLKNENSKIISYYFSVFPGLSSIEKNTLLDISGLNVQDFESSLTELTSSQLLIEVDNLYTIPQSSRRFIVNKLDLSEQDNIREHWADFYIGYLENTIIRETPSENYWNTLVSEKMIVLKKDWKRIIEVVNWLSTMNGKSYDLKFVKFTELLVHYMDSRFYNKERLDLVIKAIKACTRLHMEYQEALFRIDSLGWTYVEESEYTKANEEISKGLSIAESLKNSDDKANDVISLGKAWQARMFAQKGNSTEAFSILREALTYEGKPWIQYRIYMAAGDVYTYQDRKKEALKYYRDAKTEFNKYGGEGNNYQINPRIGLTYIKTRQFKEAKQIFENLFEEDLALGNLYSEYGLALIEYYNGDRIVALAKLEKVEEQLIARSSSNVLLKLINDFKLGLKPNPREKIPT